MMPRPPRPRGDMLRQALAAIRLLRERPRRAEEIAAELGITSRTVTRILAGIRAAGIEVESERRGQREITYSISRETLRRAMP